MNKNELGKKSKICFIVLESHQNFHWAVRSQHALRFFFLRKHHQQRATTPATERQTLRRDLERALGGEIWCVKMLFE
jgi:hypothetical protein